MSRTDAHTPYWVKLHYEGVEDHDHRFGECDFDAALNRPKRFGRNHTPAKCKKYVKYTVVCLHTFRVRGHWTHVSTPEGYRPSYEERNVISPKRHEAYIYDAKNNLVTRDKPLLPICHEHKSAYGFINEGEGFDRYKDDYRYHSRSLGRTEGFSHFEQGFARHQFTVAVRDDSITCSCDDEPNPRRRWSSCDKTPRAGEKMLGYSYYCTCNYCTPPMPPSRTAIKQALKTIARHGYDEDFDDYLDFEDVYRGQDYR